MDCGKFRQQWDLWREDALSVDEVDAVEAHRAACLACQAWERETTQLVAALGGLPAPPVPDGLADRAFARVRARTGRQVSGIAGVAAAAVLAVAVGIGVLLSGPTGDALTTVKVPLNRTETVTVALGAPRDMEDVRFTVELPEGVELEGHPDVRRLTWKGRLRAGRNALPLPVHARTTTDGELVARVQQGELSKEMRIRIQVTPAEGPEASLPDAAPSTTEQT